MPGVEYAEGEEVAQEGEDAATISALVKAAYMGRKAEVIRLLDFQPSIINRWDFLQRSYTPLMAAAEENQIDVVRLLVDRQAKLNLRSGSGWTALMYASDRGHDEVVALLLSRSADASIRGRDGRNALILACCNYYATGAVKLLLQHRGQDVDATDAKGQTALSWACYWANFAAAELLLMAGADPSIADQRGKTPKQIARKEGHDSCVGLIEWWEAHMVKRPYLLHRARSIYDDSMTMEQFPSSAVPVHLAKRAASGKPYPALELAAIAAVQSSPAKKSEGSVTTRRRDKGKKLQDPECVIGYAKDDEEDDEERAATLAFLIEKLPRELYHELSQGLRWKPGVSILLNSKKKAAGGERKRKARSEGAAGAKCGSSSSSIHAGEEKGKKKRAAAQDGRPA